MSRYITTHDSEGLAIFSDRAPTELNDRSSSGQASSSTALLYTTHNTPEDPSTEADIDRFLKDRVDGFKEGTICPPHGTSAMIATMAPGASTPMHRTMTTDIAYVLEGIVQLCLESGQMRTLSAGDSVVQRATMHKYVNVTPNDGWAKMLAMSVATVDTMTIGGKELAMEFKT